MNYLFTAPSLSKPTFETLEEYSKKKFNKIEKFIKPNNDEVPLLKISVNKDGDEFLLTVEIHTFENTLIKHKDRDLRRAIDLASHQLKDKLIKDKEKKFSVGKLKEKVQDLRNKILNREYTK